jgi:putative hydrolase of the HAD superfamily
MIKVALFDADGVVVTPEKIFSQRMHKEYGVPKEELEKFFRGDFQKCLVGSADLRELLASKVEGWNWKGTVDELLEYWFSNESQTDKRVVDIVQQLKEKGIRVYLATNQEKNRTEYFKNQMGFGELFHGIFSSAEVGYIKNDIMFWEQVLNQVAAKPQEIAFWDDSKDNIEMASSLGITAYLYVGFDEFYNQVKSLV